MARRPIKVFINKRVAKGITRETARVGTDYAALAAENLLVDMLRRTEARTGRIYTHYYFTGKDGQLRQGDKRRVPHQASAPGEVPAPDSGKLWQSVKSYTEEFGDSFRGVVGTTLEYGAYLELGTEKIAPRPWISLLAREENWSEILKAFRIGARTQFTRARRSFSE